MTLTRTNLLIKASPWLFTIGLFVFWEAVVRIFKIPTFFLPPPSLIAQAFVEFAGPIARNSWITLETTLIGFALAVGFGLLLGLVVGWSRAIYAGLYPLMIGFNAIPKVALVPILVLWFGIGFIPAVLTAFLISFFPIVIDAAVGLRSMSTEMADLAKSMGSSRWQVFAQFRLPTSLPYLFSGLKVAATLAIAGTVVGEFVGADKGLGYLLLVTNSNMETALMFATIVALTIIGLVSYYLVELLEGALIPWHVTHRIRETGTM